ncbi:hypothetical protein ACIRCZ_18990 [Leifsonia sp. NPDC102414]|uniref:hypothetical protein n=1 Tax=Leifsonia sp. NPDC102414 TaxID=3364124 RepID=UPI0038237584
MATKAFQQTYVALLATRYSNRVSLETRHIPISTMSASVRTYCLGRRLETLTQLREAGYIIVSTRRQMEAAGTHMTIVDVLKPPQDPTDSDADGDGDEDASSAGNLHERASGYR